MAVHKSLMDALKTAHAGLPAPEMDHPVTPPAAAQPARKPARKATAARTSRRAKEDTPAPSEGAQDATAASVEPREPAQVRVPTTSAAKRPTLYLHPDDFRALGLAKLDDDVDLNTRVRAMIAVWRTNPRYRAQVDRLARTSPRGPHSGQA